MAEGVDPKNYFGGACVVCDKTGTIKIRHGICLYCWNKHFTDLQ